MPTACWFSTMDRFLEGLRVREVLLVPDILPAIVLLPGACSRFPTRSSGPGWLIRNGHGISRRLAIAMETTVAIDEELIEALMRVEPGVSRSEAIRRAIEDYLRQKRLDELVTLAGGAPLPPDWREAEQTTGQRGSDPDRKQ